MAAKSHVRIAQQEYFRAHPGTNPREKGFAKVRHHVPVPAVDQAHDLFALVRILADRDIEICHIAIEWRSHIAIFDIESRPVGGRLRRLSPSVNIPVLPEFIRGARNFALCVLYRGACRRE